MTQHPAEALLQTIGYPRNGRFQFRSPVESNAVLDLAQKNKVESLYLESLSETDALDRLADEYRQRSEYQERFAETCSRVTDLLGDRVDFVFVKSIHPFPADASDVDVLLAESDDVRSLPVDFERNGYEILGTAPSAMTVEDTRTGELVDLQTFFGLHKVVYYDERELLDNVVTHDLDDAELPIPAKPYDLSLVVNHSLTELVFLLKEYYAMAHMLETSSEDDVAEFIDDIRFNGAQAGCAAFLSLVEALSDEIFSVRPKHMDLLESELGTSSHERNAFLDELTLPYRYSRLGLTRFTAEKFRQRRFRGSFLRQLPSFANPRTAGYIAAKVYGRGSRETY